MRTFTQVTLILAASATLFACKPKPEPTAPVAAAAEEPVAAEESTPAAPAERIEACTLTMTSPESAELTTYWSPAGGGGSEAHSSHWANELEKDSLAKNNQLVPVQILCSGGESPSVTVSLAAEGSTETDVPMSGGTYPIWGKQQAAALKGGQILMSSLSVDGRAFDSRSGTLTISRFDPRGVAGSFVIDGAEMTDEAAPIHIEGTFDIPCRAVQLESACENRDE
jgi:hypothetical protein